MKVVEKIEIEYVVPETPEEKAELEAIIKDFEDKSIKRNYDLSKATIVDNRDNLQSGYWRKQSS